MQKSKHSGAALRERKTTYALFTIPGVLLYSMFFIVPIIMGVYYSMTDWNGISRKFNFTGLNNYISIFSDKRFGKSLMFNLEYSLLLILGILLVSISLALLLNTKIKGRGFFRGMYFLPAVLSMLTVGLIFNQFFYRVLPMIGESLGIQLLSTNILANPKLAKYGVLFVNIWQGSAMPTVIILAGLQSIPEDLYEAAALDGANGWQRFVSITIPYLLPVLSVVLVLTLKGGLMIFDYIMSLTQGGPAGVTESVAMLIYKHGFVENKYSYGIAEAVVTGIIIASISAIQIYATNRKKV